MGVDSVISRLASQAKKQSSEPALYVQREGGVWRSITWADYWAQVCKFAGALLALGYEPGEAVCIMGNNCPEWVIADLGAMTARGVPAGVYQTLTGEKAAYIVNHCGARVFVLENAQMWSQVSEALDEFSGVEKFVMIHDIDSVDDARAVSFEDFLATGEAHLDAVETRRDEIQLEDLGTLIYTSGTTGPPKGVMLSHKNLAHTSHVAVTELIDVRPTDCTVSYLPLSHIAEQMFTIHIPISGGAKVWFCDDLKKMKEVLPVARPTIFLGVPRVYEKFKTALENRFAEQTGAKAKLIAWAQEVAKEYGYHVFAHGEPGGMLGMKMSIARKLIFAKLKAALGFDRLRIAAVGAAPIGLDVLEFFLGCDIPIHEVYGQSETSGPTTFNFPVPGRRMLGKAGMPFPQTQVELAPEDGEIIVKGDNVFMGYFKNEEATKKTFNDEGWMLSGDVGVFDDAGFLQITDRKKDLIITSGGKNVAPQNIEKKLRALDGISQAVVIGDNRKFLSALLAIDLERLPALAEERGWPADPEALIAHEPFQKYVADHIAAVNEVLARYENVRKHTVLPLDFTIEGGELTPTQKVKRRIVNEKYSAQIEAFYDGLD